MKFHEFVFSMAIGGVAACATLIVLGLIFDEAISKGTSRVADFTIVCCIAASLLVGVVAASFYFS